MARMIRTGVGRSSFCHLRLGSWGLEVACERVSDGAMLSFLHKGRVAPGRLEGADARLVIERGGSWALSSEGNDYRLVMPAPGSAHALLGFLDSGMRRVLLDQGLVVLHAAAVAGGGRVCLLVGDAGSGKSTLAVLLTRRGATLLADDRVLLRRGSAVSGCDTTVKLGDDVRDALSMGPLSGPRWTNRGMPRTEADARVVGEAAPRRDFATAGGRLIFLRVGDAVAARRLSRAEALLRLVEATGAETAGATRDQRAAVLAWLGSLVEGMSCHELTRGSRLHEMEHAADCVEAL